MNSAPAHTSPSTRRELVSWRNSVFALFATTGLVFATWVARLPSIRDSLELSTAEVGVLIFVMSVGSITGLLTSGFQVAKFGARRAVLVGLLFLGSGIGLIGIGVGVFESPIVVGIGLVIMGFGNGSVDIAMNIEGSAVERESGKTSLPLMHAFFSFGTVGGAAIAALATGLGIPPLWHLLTVGIVVVVLAFVTVRNIPANDAAVRPAAGPAEVKPTFRQRISIWADARLLLIGVIMLGMSFAEGSANDWLVLASVDGHGISDSVAAVVFGIFTVAMTVGRIFGGPIVDKFGRVPVLQVSALVAVVGLLTFILAPTFWVIVVGVVLWGLGTSLGFPVGMSAAGDDAKNATARVSAVAGVSYLTFLAGPAIIGFLGDTIGLLNAFYLVLALIVLSGLASPAARSRRNLLK